MISHLKSSLTSQFSKQNSEEKLPILFFISQTGKGNGGVESITLVLERLKKFIPTIITNLELPVNDRWQTSETSVKIWPLLSTFQGSKFSLLKPLYQLVSFLVCNFRAYTITQAKKYKIVHFNDIQALTQAGLGVKLAGAEIVFNIRDTKQSKEAYGLKWQLYARLSDRIIVLSKEMQDFLCQALRIRRKDKVVHIYSTVDKGRFYPVFADDRALIRQRLGILKNTFAIGYIASVNSKKNQLELIQKMCVPLFESLPEARLYMVGQFQPDVDTYAQDCQKASKQLGIDDRVSFTGYTPSVSDWYRALDLVIIVSRREGLARCMIESLSCGTPVVSFDVCSAKEILVNHSCGRVVLPGNYSAMISEISELANNPALMSEYRQNGLKTATELFSENNVAYYEQVYAEMIKS